MCFSYSCNFHYEKRKERIFLYINSAHLIKKLHFLRFICCIFSIFCCCLNILFCSAFKSCEIWLLAFAMLPVDWFTAHDSIWRFSPLVCFFSCLRYGLCCCCCSYCYRMNCIDLYCFELDWIVAVFCCFMRAFISLPNSVWILNFLLFLLCIFVCECFKHQRPSSCEYQYYQLPSKILQMIFCHPHPYQQIQ